MVMRVDDVGFCVAERSSAIEGLLFSELSFYGCAKPAAFGHVELGIVDVGKREREGFVIGDRIRYRNESLSKGCDDEAAFVPSAHQRD